MMSQDRSSIRNFQQELKSIIKQPSNKPFISQPELKPMLPSQRSSHLSDFDGLGSKSVISINREKANNLFSKINNNQLSHYITIIVLGLYFIITTIPFSIVLAFTNQLTLKLNYHLPDQESYLNDETWILYGQFRDYVMLFKLFFISNHCVNFFFYLSFNRAFRSTLCELFVNLKNKMMCLIVKSKPRKKTVQHDHPLVRL